MAGMVVSHPEGEGVPIENSELPVVGGLTVTGDALLLVTVIICGVLLVKFETLPKLRLVGIRVIGTVATPEIVKGANGAFETSETEAL